MAIETKHINGRLHYNCRNECGNFVTRKGGQCRKCYTLHPSPTTRNKPYNCKNNCGTKVGKAGSLCKSCYDKVLLELGEKRQRDKQDRDKINETRVKNKLGGCKNQSCPQSENGSHYETISPILVKEIDANKNLFEIVQEKDRVNVLFQAKLDNIKVEYHNIGVCKFCGRIKDYSVLQTDFLELVTSSQVKLGKSNKK